MNYRDKLEIIADVLTVASRNAKQTQIMYQANLSYKVMRRYLDQVVEASLVNFYPEGQYYMLTEKGKTFLATFRDYFKTSKTIEKHLEEMRSKKRILEDLCRSNSNQTECLVEKAN
jgi:predicted transcriptional regulator